MAWRADVRQPYLPRPKNHEPPFPRAVKFQRRGHYLSMTEMDAPAMFMAPSSISDLPIEVLVEIFSYIPMQVKVECGHCRKSAQIMVFMHVCRSFRTAVFESRAFLDWEFDFACLIPHSGPHDLRTIPRLTRLLETLFADEYLLHTLARKREWKFCEPPDVLLTVLARIPTFAHSAQKVYLSLDDFTDRALNRLSICPGIIELGLDIQNDDSSIHLDEIPQYFPRLQHLKLYTPRQVHGSLHALKHLVSLEVASAIDEGSEFRAIGQNIFPFNSAETLTSLKIPRGFLDYSEFKLVQFRKLRHLTFEECLPDQIIRAMQGFDVHLETFEFHIRDLPDLGRPSSYSDYEPIFSLPSLAYLQTLTVRGIQDQDPDYDYAANDHICICVPMVYKITNRLQHLTRILFVYVGVDPDELRCLSRLRNLKSITWVLGESFIWGDRLPEDGLSEAFESFEVKPKIEVVMDEEFNYGRNSRWPSNF
jgi:F-box domain